MSKSKILMQLDSDRHPSPFDAVVAVDSGVDHLIQYGHVEAGAVRDLIHGLMFTRGPDDLHCSAVFVGGSDVKIGEQIGEQLQDAFFGDFSVSVLLDPNGANTTAAAAVLSLANHLDLAQSQVVVLASTGPVGQRVCRLLAGQGAKILAASRSTDRAQILCSEIRSANPNGRSATITAIGFDQPDKFKNGIHSADAIISCGAAGYELLSEKQLNQCTNCRVAIDLNAVPPSGLGGIGIMDRAESRQNRIDYGAIGVGQLKMKIHKAAIAKLFELNNQFFDADELFELGRDL